MDVRNTAEGTAAALGTAEALRAAARGTGSARLRWAAENDALHCVIGWPGDRPALASVLPLFDQLGLSVVDHRPAPGADEFTFRDTLVQADDEAMTLLGAAFLAAWERRCDRDGFARLALVAGLRARQVQLVRVAYGYLRQASLGASRRYVQDILGQHADFVRNWVEVFEARFDPTGVAREPDDLDRLVEAATTREDRVLRRVRRVRHGGHPHQLLPWRSAGQPSTTIAVKLDPTRLPFLAEPRPLVETFVYHPDVEGLHVRCGRTARGGLRWSDRMEDYRAEVLALVRAQQVKNALIVPAGAKGVFVTRRPLAELAPADATAEVRRCYRIFVRGLLDVTDTIVGGNVVHPPGSVVHDEPDPYLVVAADKGTSAFSDLANAEAEAAGFWLGDAFASGGSAGYDHKRLGVTARGAWVCVCRHFAELGVDVDSDEFTVVGIGDMSGDVFGNGMLLSQRIRLVAAFDHRHIFLDPDPDPERSFAERRRLARQPGSSWADYDPALLSAGSGVFPRSARAVPISPPVGRRLGVQARELAPDELVQAILRAPVDLLWNGGVGTYVKSSHESQPDAGDRANDRVRVDADQLRCRVIGEGGNLGLTQAARIEYALAGGKINTDLIDNAAGGEHLRPGGQPEDPATRPGGGRPAEPRRAGRVARRLLGRRGGSGARGQPPPDHGDQHRRGLRGDRAGPL